MKTKENIFAIGLVLLLTFSCVFVACDKEDDDSNYPSNSSNSSNSSSGTSGGSGCPTTAACGCSAYTKAECNAHYICCKWTVGQGCGCK